jgi:hypothetical protein
VKNIFTFKMFLKAVCFEEAKSGIKTGKQLINAMIEV